LLTQTKQFGQRFPVVQIFFEKAKIISEALMRGKLKGQLAICNWQLVLSDVEVWATCLFLLFQGSDTVTLAGLAGLCNCLNRGLDG